MRPPMLAALLLLWLLPGPGGVVGQSQGKNVLVSDQARAATCWADTYDYQTCCQCDMIWCWVGTFAEQRKDCCGTKAPAVSEDSRRLRNWVCSKDFLDSCKGATDSDKKCREAAIWLETRYDPQCRALMCRFYSCMEGCALARILLHWTPWSQNSFGSTKRCLQVVDVVSHGRKVAKQLPDAERTLPNTWFRQVNRKVLGLCEETRSHELDAHRRKLLTELRGEDVARRRLRPERIAVVLAVSPGMLPDVQPSISHWQCYCATHGHAFILETTDQRFYPNDTRTHVGTGLPRWKVWKEWNRWLAIERWLPYYDWVYSIDPDQFISRECFNSLPLTEALRLAGGDDDRPPSLVIRDDPDHHCPNSAGIFLRNDPVGLLALRLVLEKMWWKGVRWGDQGAFDLAVVELLSIEFDMTKELGCLSKALPMLIGGWDDDAFFECYKRALRLTAGKFAGRNHTRFMHFLDPRAIDINYVVGSRTSSDAPLVWHLAGFAADWQAFLANQLGLGNREFSEVVETSQNCTELRRIYSAMEERNGGCSPGTPVKKCCCQLQRC